MTRARCGHPGAQTDGGSEGIRRGLEASPLKLPAHDPKVETNAHLGSPVLKSLHPLFRLAAIVVFGVFAGCEVASGPADQADAVSTDTVTATDTSELRRPAPADAVQLRGSLERGLFLRRGR